MEFVAGPGGVIPEDVEGLIFDCDGTLIDTMPLHYRAWVQALAPYGLKMAEDQFYAFAGMPTKRIIEELSRDQGISVQAQRVAVEKEHLYAALIPTASAIEAVIEVARREQGRRKLAVASGGWHKLVRTSLEATGISELFPVVVGADDVEHGKPHPDVFLKAASLLGLSPERCLVYEDGELGFEAARRAKMRVVDVRPWYMDAARLELVQAGDAAR